MNKSSILITSPPNNLDISELNVFYETAYAEYGSALEMLAACKTSHKSTHVFGYFEHAKDEYKHTQTFLSILSNSALRLPSSEARNLRFKSLSVISKGYVSKEGYLIENMNIKDFIAFVYTNELLAKESFDRILRLVGPDSSDGIKISHIMKDELRHHGMARDHFIHYYPSLQPWQLRLYRFREVIKNKSRKFYRKNLLFLEKLFYPLYKLMAFFVGRLLIILSLKEFKRNGINLMELSPKSLL